MKNAKHKKIILHPEASCLTCSNCISIGEGDHICYKGNQSSAMVISDYAPTDEYMACEGKYYET